MAIPADKSMEITRPPTGVPSDDYLIRNDYYLEHPQEAEAGREELTRQLIAGLRERVETQTTGTGIPNQTDQ